MVKALIAGGAAENHFPTPWVYKLGLRPLRRAWALLRTRGAEQLLRTTGSFCLLVQVPSLSG
jgi:hypothetical protein